MAWLEGLCEPEGTRGEKTGVRMCSKRGGSGIDGAPETSVETVGGCEQSGVELGVATSEDTMNRESLSKERQCKEEFVHSLCVCSVAWVDQICFLWFSAIWTFV